MGTEHLLLGLMRDGETVASTALENLGVRPEAVKAQIERALADVSASHSLGSGCGARPNTGRSASH